MQKLTSREFIDVATSPAEEPDPPAVEDVRAMELLVSGFPPASLDAAKRSDSIFRRIHEEMANVQRQDGGTRVATATTRCAAGGSLPRSPSTFEMVREWDPEDKKA
jgi:hypothetical protein